MGKGFNMASRINVEIDEVTLKGLVVSYLMDQLGNINLQPQDVVIEVKSKCNYKSEWEHASFRARIDLAM